jgi:hypothetical protein
MPDIVATIGDPAANSYLSLADADKAMDGFPNALAWLNLDEATRQRHLLDGSRRIDRFKAWIPKQDPAQALAFPTKKDPTGELPPEVPNALLEFLDFQASGEMASIKRLQAEGVTNRSIMGQSTTFKADASQLPAGARNELEKLWRLYSSPVMVRHPHRQMFVRGLTNQSPFSGDPVNSFDNGPLEPLSD